MNKEDTRRAAYREIITQDDLGQESRYTVRVSGVKAEIIHTWPVPWEDEHGQGDNTEQHAIELSTADLKRLLAAAQWCIERSEAFEEQEPALEACPYCGQHHYAGQVEQCPKRP